MAYYLPDCTLAEHIQCLLEELDNSQRENPVQPDIWPKMDQREYLDILRSAGDSILLEIKEAVELLQERGLIHLVAEDS